MAQQGSGLGKGPDPAMVDQTSFNARNGAAKKTQKSFETKWGMSDQTRTLAGVSPADPGTGPDASSGNPMDPESLTERGKVPKRNPLPGEMKTPWGMTGADGKGLDTSIGGKVIGEAILSGSAKLPTSESYSTGGPGKP